MMFTWARFAGNCYECSTRGDARFSALRATLQDGRTIEEAYQLDVKGYRIHSNNWRDGKGKKSLREVNLWHEYKLLWWQWAFENIAEIQDLRRKAHGKVLTDMFASSDISQARALAIILNATC